jgi:protein MpaA
LRQHVSGWRFPALAALVVILLSVSLGRAGGSYVTASFASVRIGASVQDRPLDVSCVGTGAQTVLIVGGIHTGLEAITSILALEIAGVARTGELAVPSALRLCVLPMLNVDGMALAQRTNANSVDLNRNWPSADWRATAFHSGPVGAGTQSLSEPETRALFDYIIGERPDVVLMLHCCGDLVEANEAPEASHLARVYAAGAGLTYIDEWKAYPITGQFIDSMQEQGIPAIDIELGQRDETDFDAHRAGVIALMYYLATHPPVGYAAATPTMLP